MNQQQLQNLISLENNLTGLPALSFTSKIKLNNQNKVEVESNILSNSTTPDAMGFKRTIDTLTSIRTGIIEQTFYTLGLAQNGEKMSPSDFIPFNVNVGNNVWADSILTYQGFDSASSFEDGYVNTGNGKLEEVGFGTTSVQVKVKNWAKLISYSIFELNQAVQSGNWDLVAQLERTRKTNWDLGIQKVAFLGADSDSSVQGLLNLTGVQSNTSLITKPLSAMDVSEYTTFLGALLTQYKSNVESTVLPNELLISDVDYAGLIQPYSPSFPMNSKLEYLEKSWKLVTMNPTARVYPIAYCNSAHNNLGLNRYVMYRNDPQTLSMFVPINYTSVIANSTLNGIQYQNAAYGRHSGVQAFKPQEILYFDYN